jgi:xanthine dehydrogenase YagS FAD-binding subunit
MNPFTYHKAKDTADAIAAASPTSKFLAGGTTLVDLMKLYVEQPATLVDITRLPISDIKPGRGGYEIGAGATNTAVAEDSSLTARYPVLSQAILSGASVSLRNMATVGGNLLQRTRCTYFRDGISKCNKRTPGSGCDAKEGFGRSLAVLGASDDCAASHPSDMCVALVALDAVIRVEGAKGKRDIAVGDFHLLPGRTPEKETVLEPGELITSVFIPDSPRAKNSAYFKVRDRASYEFALASCAVACEMVEGRVASIRIALGGVGTRPWRAETAERVLMNGKPGVDLFNVAAAAALADAKPHKDNAFKVDLAKRVIVKALQSVCKV